MDSNDKPFRVVARVFNLNITWVMLTWLNISKNGEGADMGRQRRIHAKPLISKARFAFDAPLRLRYL